jgi:hypothetical protein
MTPTKPNLPDRSELISQWIDEEQCDEPKCRRGFTLGATRAFAHADCDAAATAARHEQEIAEVREASRKMAMNEIYVADKWWAEKWRICGHADWRSIEEQNSADLMDAKAKLVLEGK